MSENLRAALRAGFAELTDAPTPIGLDAVAVRHARRRVAAQVAGAAALVAALAAGTVVGAGALTRDRSAPPATGTGVVLLAAASCQPGSTFDRYDQPVRSYVLDRRTGSYVTLPYCGVVPSPDGRLAVVADGDPSVGRPERQGIMDLATRQVRWIPKHTGAVSWAPDSRHLLLLAAYPGPGTVVIDAARPQTSTAVALPPPGSVPIAVPVWQPDSTIKVLRCRGCPPESKRPGFETVLSPGGYPDHGITLTGRPWSPLPVASPDGSEIAVPRLARHDNTRTPYVQILDARTGAYRGRLDLPTETELVGWYDHDHLITRVLPEWHEVTGTYTGPNGRSTYHPIDSWPGRVDLQVLDRAGHVLRTITRSPGLAPLEYEEIVTIAPAAGRPDPHGVGF